MARIKVKFSSGITCFFLFVILLLSFLISKNLVGAFDRILKELDEVIDGKDRNKIGVRVRDDLANELLSRVNVLIKNLPKPRTKLER